MHWDDAIPMPLVIGVPGLVQVCFPPKKQTNIPTKTHIYPIKNSLSFFFFSETTFSNEYFRLLIEEKWTIKKTHEGKPWTGPVQFESPDGALMMLPSDIAMVQGKSDTHVMLTLPFFLFTL